MNNSVLLPVVFRWIVGGERAKIKSLELTPSDDIIINIIGAPTAATAGDFSFETPVDPMPAKILLTWGTQEFFSKDIDLLNYSDILSISLSPVVGRIKGGEVDAKIVSLSGEVLAQKSLTVLPIPQSLPILWFVIGGIAIFLGILVTYFYSRSHRGILPLVILFLSVFFFIQPEPSYALSATYGNSYLGDARCVAQGYSLPTLTLSSPVPDQDIICGQTITITGIATHEACSNSSGPFTVKYRFINTTSNLKTPWQNLSKTYKSGVAGSGHSWAGINYQINRDIVVPADITLYNHIEFYLHHQVTSGWACGGISYYRQPIK